MSFSPMSKYGYACASKYILSGVHNIDNTREFDDVGYVEHKITINKYKQVKEKHLWWVEELDGIYQRGKEIGTIINIIIHGSYGDNTFTSFSDLDLTLLISDDVFSNNKARQLTREWLMRELNPFMVRVDPLQHHGAFFLWEGLLNNYNEMILPLASYQESWALDDLSLIFRIPKASDTSEQYGSFITTVSNLLESENKFFKYGMNPYSIKRLMSNFVLLPAFYYQSKGIIVNKSNAIELMKEEVAVGSGIHRAIISATILRNEWPVSPSWLGFLRSKIVKEHIPGRLDYAAISIYRNSKIEAKFKSELLNILPVACQEFFKMGKL